MKAKINVLEQLRLENQICFSLYSSTLRLMKLYRPLLKKIGLTYPQYLAMLVLWEHKIVSVSELGSRLQLDSGTLTPMLKRMEKMSLVMRMRNADDERVVEITLTKQGKDLKEKAKSIPETIFCLSGISKSELFPLKRSLDRLAT